MDENKVTPAMVLEEIRAKMESGEATADEIEFYVTEHEERAARRALNDAKNNLVVRDLEEQLKAHQTQAASAYLELTELAFDALERLENAE